MAAPTATEVAALLGRDPLDLIFAASVTEALTVITEFTRAYTRGQGFTPTMADDISAVILAAACRLVVNPAQVESERADAWSASGRFDGYTIVEQLVLNRYRVRTA